MPISSLRVLVLEDGTSKRSGIAEMLGQLGCRDVHAAQERTTALAMLQQVGFVDVVICDMRLVGYGGMKGLADCARVGAVILSGYLPKDLRYTAKQIVIQSGLNYLGTAEGRAQRESLAELLNAYCAKCTPNEIKVVADPEFNLKDIIRALYNREFRAHFQPKLCLATGDVRGIEVLVRWEHPTCGLIAPALFLPLMKQQHLMDDLLFELLEQSLALHNAAKQYGFHLNMALNVLPSQFDGLDMVERLQGALARHDVAASSLTFELVESEAFKISARNLDSLFQLRMFGCNLAIDDFGTGYSSLQRLCQLPFTELKVDGSFIKYLNEDHRCAAVVRNVLALGEALGVAVVVEGIETKEQYETLLTLGCLLGQGYLLAHPMNPAALLRWLKESSQAKWHLDRQLPAVSSRERVKY